MDKLMKDLRKISIRRVTTPIVICMLFAAFFFFMEIDHFQRIQNGAKYLEDLEVDELRHYVVHSDAYYVLDCFAEYGDEGATEADKYYYIIYYKDDKYIAAGVDAEDAALMDEVCSDTWDYILGETSYLEKSCSLEGTIYKMSDEEKKYYIEWFEEMGFSDEEIAECALPYVLNNGVGTDLSSIYFFWWIAFVLALVSLVLFVMAASGGCQIRVKKDFAKLGELAQARIPEDYANAFVIGDRMRIGRIFTYDCSHFLTRAYLNEEIVWVYPHVTTHRLNLIFEIGQTFRMILHDIHGNKFKINGKRALCTQAMGFYEAKFPHMVLGYSDELRRLYNRERPKFLALRYNEAKQNENSYDRLMEPSQSWNGEQKSSDNPYETPTTYGNNKYHI